MMTNFSALDILDVAVALAKDNEVSELTVTEFMAKIRNRGYLHTVQLFESALEYLSNEYTEDGDHIYNLTIGELTEGGDWPPPWRNPDINDDESELCSCETCTMQDD